MTNKTPLEKRIKRHVSGRIRDFFAVTAPGFEDLCLDELMALPLSVKEAVTTLGGVEFKGKLADCWLANLHLRTANRVLMRIGMFKATNFKQLERKLSDFPWEFYLFPGQIPQFSISTSHSRLYHKDAIAERVKKNIVERFKNIDAEMPHDLSFPQKIYIRIVDDWFTISIDSSGENLYKRGMKQFVGKAPLRETIAAAALKIAGYTGREPLADPMCGSGSFSIEAAMIASGIPPGSFRDFAFMGWPSFKPARWAYLHRESEISRINGDMPLIFASDKDENLCSALRKNIKEKGLDEIIKVRCRDFFDFSPKELTGQTGLAVINPPYGLRIGTRKESSDLFRAICSHLKKEYKGWKIALIAPEREFICYVPFKVRQHPFFHGGLKLTLLTGKI